MKQKVLTLDSVHKTAKDAKQASEKLIPEYRKTATVKKLPEKINNREWGLYVMDYKWFED